jgi:prepilin-type processing-associated H-X9-DG protein
MHTIFFFRQGVLCAPPSSTCRELTRQSILAAPGTQPGTATAQRVVDGDLRNVKIHRCSAHPEKRQTVCLAVNIPNHLSASDSAYLVWAGRRLPRQRHREGYSALYFDGHVRHLQSEPDVPQFRQLEHRM